MSLPRISGLVLGAISLLAGVLSLASGEPWLGLLAGAIGAIGGVAAYMTVSDNASVLERATNAEKEASSLRAELATAATSLEEERARSADLSKSLSTYLETNPPAGSFEKKLADTAHDFNPEAHGPADGNMLADPETNLFSEAYFKVALDARIASARRHLRPVAVAILEVVEGEGRDRSLAADPTKVTGAIRRTLRDADTACRLTDGSFALILEDTPENGAVWTVERIRRNLSSRHGQHTTWAGIACYPAHAFSTEEILDQASVALDSAREWQQDRIEVATAD